MNGWEKGFSKYFAYFYRKPRRLYALYLFQCERDCLNIDDCRVF